MTIGDGINEFSHHDVKFTIRENCFARRRPRVRLGQPSRSALRRPVRVPLRRESHVHRFAPRGEGLDRLVSARLNIATNINAETSERGDDDFAAAGMRPRGWRGGGISRFVPDRGRSSAAATSMSSLQELLYALSRYAARSRSSRIARRRCGRWLLRIFSRQWCSSRRHGRDPEGDADHRHQLHGWAPPAFLVVGWDHETEGRMVAEIFSAPRARRLALIGTRRRRAARTHAVNGYAAACRAACHPLQRRARGVLETRTLLYAAVNRVFRREADAIFLPVSRSRGRGLAHLRRCSG